MRQADVESLSASGRPLTELPNISSSYLISAHEIILPIDVMEVLFAYEVLYKYGSVCHFCFLSQPYACSEYTAGIRLCKLTL